MGQKDMDIYEILKGVPAGTELYTPMCGNVEFRYLQDNKEAAEAIITNTDNGAEYTFNKNGKYVEEGEVLLFPSERMRDWSKFFKKGDVLVSEDGCVHIIFEKFVDYTYTNFIGKHYFDGDDKLGYSYISGRYTANTKQFRIEEGDAVQTYINTIEKRLGGKLNLETLEIEKQTEFKDGDIVVTDAVPSLCYSKCILILKGDLNTNENSANSYVFFNINNNRISFDVLDTTIRYRNIRLATEEEKRQLFDAIEKDGKAWDAEKKQVVRLQVSDKLYYFEMENELAYIAKLKEAKGGKYIFESNVSWCPRNSTNGYDYEEGSFIVSDKGCYGFRKANADECKIFEKFLVEHAMKSFKFKALDYVLAKNITCFESNAWNLFQYAYRNKDGVHIMVGGAAFLQCIPYVGNEDLLGTTKLYSTKNKKD